VAGGGTRSTRKKVAKSSDAPQEWEKKNATRSGFCSEKGFPTVKGLFREKKGLEGGDVVNVQGRKKAAALAVFSEKRPEVKKRLFCGRKKALKRRGGAFQANLGKKRLSKPNNGVERGEGKSS